MLGPLNVSSPSRRSLHFFVTSPVVLGMPWDEKKLDLLGLQYMKQ